MKKQYTKVSFKIMDTETKEEYLERMNAFSSGTLMEAMGIEYTKIELGLVEGRFSVNKNTRRMAGGILHGGASLAVAETLAGLGSMVYCEDGEAAVGIQISANHIAMAHDGEEIFVRASIIHAGRTTHVWDVNLYVIDRNKHISTVRVTNSIINI